MPRTRSTPSAAPSWIIGIAPEAVSSAGWKQSRTRPDQLSRNATSALQRQAPCHMTVVATCVHHTVDGGGDHPSLAPLG